MTKHINSVRELRKYQQQFSTKEFRARGYLLKRCPECLLAESMCVCDLVAPVDTNIAVCMLMYHGEYYKPSNTGQLICSLVKDNHAFRWQRTEYEAALKNLLEDEQYYPIIVFPHDAVETQRQIHAIPEQKELNGKRPLLIFLDGTWRQAKKMMIKSPYLAELPVLQVSDVEKGDYILRESYHEHHLSTVEVAREIFHAAGEIKLAQDLNTLFTTFRDNYQILKR